MDYQAIAEHAVAWRKQHSIPLAATDQIKSTLYCIDYQCSFTVPPPDGSLFVGGSSGDGAIKDVSRVCDFLLKNLPQISKICSTLDTHITHQIFFPTFWVDEKGNHPSPGTMISVSDVESGKWEVNRDIAWALTEPGSTPNYLALKRHGLHYVRTLAKEGKYSLIIWPYHVVLGGVGNCLHPLYHQAEFFHSVVRASQPQMEIKGCHPLTEAYGPGKSEVDTDGDGNKIANINAELIGRLMNSDILIVAGEARSHCVRSGINYLLDYVNSKDPALAKKVYILADCTSDVVIPPPVNLDFTAQGEEAFKRFAAAGMHLVKSTTPISEWPDSPFKK